MSNLGRLVVDLIAKTGGFETDMGRAAKTAEKRMKDIERSVNNGAKVIAAAMAAGAAAVVVSVKSTIDAADGFAKMSQKVGVGVEALSTLAYAADQSGVSLQQLQGGLVKLAKNASDAASGAGDAIKAFDAMGLSVTDASGKLKTTDALLKELADKFAGYEDSAQKTALAVQVLGRAGAELIPMLNEGAEGISQLQQAARDLGLEVTENTAKAAERFNDRMSDMSKLARGFANDLTDQLVPGLAALATHFVEAGKEARNTKGGAEQFADGIRTVIGVAIAGAAAIQKLGASAGAVAVSIGNLGTMIQAQAASVQQFQKDVFEIGPIDAYAKFASASFGNIGDAVSGVERNMAQLKETFAEIDDDAVAQIGALGTKFVDTGVAIGDTAAAAKTAAPAIAATGAAANTAASDYAKAQRELSKYAAEMQRGAGRAARDLNRMIAEQAAQLGGPAARAAKDYADALNDIAEIQSALMEIGPIDPSSWEALQQASDQAGVLFEAALENADELNQLLDQINDTPMDRLVSEIDRVGKALDGMLTDEQRQKLTAYMKELQGEMVSVRQQGLERMVGAAQEVIGAMQTMAKQGSKEYKALGAAQHALNLVMAIGGIVNQANGDPYTAWARMAAMAVTMASYVGANFGGSTGFTDTAAARQASQGTGSVLGAPDAKSESMQNSLDIIADATSQLPGLNRGMLRALQQMQNSIGTATGMLARGAGDVEFGAFDPGRMLNARNGAAMGAVFGSIIPVFGTIIGAAVGWALGGLLRGSSRLTDQGIAIGGGSLADPGFSAYQEHQVRRWRFGSRRTVEQTAALPADVTRQFEMIMDSIVSTVQAGAEALGLLPADIESALATYRVAEMEISLRGLSADEQQQELQAVFSSIFDGLAGHVVPFIEQFQRVGEGLGETLVRVATGVQVTQEAMARLGFVLGETDPELFAQISVGLIELTGGMEEFIEGMLSFVDKFAPEAHKFAALQRDLTNAFAESGLAVPATRDAMWELMQSLDATTESGRAQIATLLLLSDVADRYYSQLEREAERMAAALENLRDALRDAADEAVDWRMRMAGRIAGVGGDDNRADLAAENMTAFRAAIDLSGPVDRAIADLERFASGVDAWLSAAIAEVDAALAATRARITGELDGLGSERDAIMAGAQARAQQDAEWQRAAGAAQQAMQQAMIAALQEQLSLAQAMAGVAEQAGEALRGLAFGADNPASLSVRSSLLQAEIDRVRGAMEIASGSDRAQLAGDLLGLLQQRQGMNQELFQRPSPEALEAYNQSVREISALRDEAQAEADRAIGLQEQIAALQGAGNAIASGGYEQQAQLSYAEQERLRAIEAQEFALRDDLANAERVAQLQRDAINAVALEHYLWIQTVGEQLHERRHAELLAQVFGVEAAIRDMQPWPYITDGSLPDIGPARGPVIGPMPYVSPPPLPTPGGGGGGTPRPGEPIGPDRPFGVTVNVTVSGQVDERRVGQIVAEEVVKQASRIKRELSNA